MKKTVSYFVFFFIAISVSANGQRSKQNRYMFEEFTNGKVLMKNRGVVNTTFNYDWISQEINYMNGQEQMILTGLEMIDTVYMADRKFIPYGNIFLEVIPVGEDFLFVNWKMDVKNKGKAGAMGMTSHATTSQKVDVGNLKGHALEKSDIYVYDASFANTYYIRVDDKFKIFNSEKSFLKLFPKEKAEEIKAYIKKEHVDFKKPSDVITLVGYVVN